MMLEIGKTYRNCLAQNVTIETETQNPARGIFRMRGVDERGALVWYSRTGRHASRPQDADLVALADLGRYSAAELADYSACGVAPPSHPQRSWHK
jgi:hypothetical protein